MHQQTPRTCSWLSADYAAELLHLRRRLGRWSRSHESLREAQLELAIHEGEVAVAAIERSCMAWSTGAANSGDYSLEADSPEFRLGEIRMAQARTVAGRCVVDMPIEF